MEKSAQEGLGAHGGWMAWNGNALTCFHTHTKIIKVKKEVAVLMNNSDHRTKE